MIIAPKNWQEFQHYKDRAPSWVKLHRSLLDNYDFHCLPVASKALAPMLWLLASEHQDGHLDADHQKIAFRLRMQASEVADAITPLMQKGFFVVVDDASKLLAETEQDASLEREKETEEEKENPPNGGLAPGAKPGTPATPHQEIIALYHEILPVCPTVREWNDTRKKYLQARWREKPERQSLEWWRKFFSYVAKSDFLTGKMPGRNNGPPFTADLEWLIKPSNFAKVIEGRYENRGTTTTQH